MANPLNLSSSTYFFSKISQNFLICCFLFVTNSNPNQIFKQENNEKIILRAKN